MGIFTEKPEDVGKSYHLPRRRKEMAKEDYKVWECKIVVSANAKLPRAFDGLPRQAAQGAVEEAGIPVVAVLSGWGGELTDGELEAIEGNG
jgi:hypothetical protein